MSLSAIDARLADPDGTDRRTDKWADRGIA